MTALRKYAKLYTFLRERSKTITKLTNPNYKKHCRKVNTRDKQKVRYRLVKAIKAAEATLGITK
jgi:hypothetical protein